MKRFTLFTLAIFFGAALYAQPPQAIQYQAVVRDNAGQIIADKPVFFKISILGGSASGTVVYRENHTGKATNAFGLVNLEIGKGASDLGTFAAINWGSGSYFIKVEIFPSGASGWQEMGTMQLLSVPYALYAKDVENKNDADADPANEIQSLSVSGTNLTLSKGGGTVPVTGDNWGAQVAKTNATLTGQGTENSPLGIVISEIKPLWGNVQSIPDGFADGIDNTADGDTSRTNEIQKLTISGTLLTLDKEGGTVTLPSSGGGDNWGAQVAKTNATLTGQGTDASPLGVVHAEILPDWSKVQNKPAGFADGIDNTEDADADLNNEIQVLSKSGNTVTLSKNGGSFVDAVDDADNNSTNEIQALSISGSNLSLSKDGGTVALPGDNWGAQSATTDATLAGNGTAGTPLKIAGQGAVNGQVLKWSGTSWIPQNDLSGSTLPAGSTGYIQFNSAGNFGGDPSFFWDITNRRLGIRTSSPEYPLHVTSFTDGVGIFASALQTSGSVTAIKATTQSNSGSAIAGYASNVSGTARGVYGYSGSASGYSGYFEGGNFFVESQAEINDTLSMKNHVIANVANPVNAGDAATKAYVDAIKETIFNELLEAGLNAVVRDVEGNSYKTIKIGTQVWMAENLRTRILNTGDTIPGVTNATAWANLTTPGYCWYNHDQTSHGADYGALYNWNAVNTGKLCPEGWHAPSDADWTILTTFLGGETLAGGKMKESGTAHWNNSNTGATNESGFSALPGGYRSGGYFDTIGYYGIWWSSSETSSANAWIRYMNFNYANIFRDYSNKGHGCSVRCVRDNASVTLPTVITSPLTGITQTTSTGGGNVTSDGGAEVTARGVCWSTAQNPTVSDNKTTDGTGTGSFTSSLAGLTAGTQYYVRAYATNSAGTSYGGQVEFTTSQVVEPPAVSTSPVTDITQTTATGGGNVTSDGGAEVTARGVCWSTAQNPTVSDNKTTDGTGTGSFTSSLAGLTAGTQYYVRAYATNSAGTSYGGQVEFTTSQVVEPPAVSTSPVTDITQTTATGGGNVTSDGGAEVTARGVCWSTAQNPTVSDNKTTDGTGTGSFTSSLTGLTAGTQYYVRAYATNSAGTEYGNEVFFTPPTSGNPTESFTDPRDGKVYKTVKIGEQWWMAENLAWLPSVYSPLAESNITPYYYVYNYSGTDISAAKATANYSTFGVLYNWPAAMTACPEGWHLPNDAEWTTLTNYLINNGYGYEGSGDDIAKSMASTTNWFYDSTPGIPGNDQTSNNSSGFSGPPGGFRYGSNYFGYIEHSGNWWSSTEGSVNSAWARYLFNNRTGFDLRHNGKEYGFSVRCVSDNASVTLPTVITDPITGITHATASGGGYIPSDGGATVTARGVCWSTSENPTTTGSKTSDGTGTGSYTSNLTGLTAGTQYYVRAYATNSAGTYYGFQVSFMSEIENCGTISDIDGNTYKTVQIGTQCWMRENLKATKYNDGTGIPNVNGNPQWAGMRTGAYCWYNNDIGNKAVYGALYNWYAVTTYKLCPAGWHVPATEEWTLLSNHLGGETVAGGKLKETGTTHWQSPNTGATNESGFSGLPGGLRTDVFKAIGEDGRWWSSTQSAPDNAWHRNLGYDYSSLDRDSHTENLGYSVRCVKGALPSVTTNPITNIYPNTATGGGNVTSQGDADVTARGVCWSTSNNPTISDKKTVDGTGTGSFTSSLDGLTLNTTYYVRAYATNSLGTAYGQQESFTADYSNCGTINDVDGNTYQTVLIGTQCWMRENLKTTKYNDGVTIPLVTDNAAWSASSTEAMCWYNNDDTNYKVPYGALYNWYVVYTGKLCPAGWHVPSLTEWSTLATTLGEAPIAGGKMKEEGTVHWQSPNTGATNESGFTALPGGKRNNLGYFQENGGASHWWSSTPYIVTFPQTDAWSINLNFSSTGVANNTDKKQSGNSIRCVRD